MGTGILPVHMGLYGDTSVYRHRGLGVPTHGFAPLAHWLPGSLFYSQTYMVFGQGNQCPLFAQEFPKLPPCWDVLSTWMVVVVLVPPV